MSDQAEGLRRISQQSKSRIHSNFLPRGGTPTSPKVITVTSGKGGVGKTSLVVNLSLALAKLGKKVVIIDADLGCANVEVLLGSFPPYTLYDILYGDKSIDEIIMEGPEGIEFISGGSGLQELANLGSEQRERIINS